MLHDGAGQCWAVGVSSTDFNRFQQIQVSPCLTMSHDVSPLRPAPGQIHLQNVASRIGCKSLESEASRTKQYSSFSAHSQFMLIHLGLCSFLLLSRLLRNIFEQISAVTCCIWQGIAKQFPRSTVTSCCI